MAYFKIAPTAIRKRLAPIVMVSGPVSDLPWRTLPTRMRTALRFSPLLHTPEAIHSHS
jgi:hypothetical protein